MPTEESPSEFILHNVYWIQPGQSKAQGYVHVVDGKIAVVAPGEAPTESNVATINGNGALLTPGLIDMHTHGIHTWCYDNGPRDLLAATKTLPEYGVTSVIPTVVPKTDDAYLKQLDVLCSAIPETQGTTIPGIHLEGPFVAITGAACETYDGDINLLKDLLEACQGRVAVMSISPEVKNIIPIIEYLVAQDIVPFITHTRATVEDTLKAMDAGASHATHFYDVFPIPEEKDPGVRPVGVVECILGDPRGTCDFICDGVHVDPMAIRAGVAAKGWQGVSLISDASFGAGMPPGDYDTPWGYPVNIAPGNAPRIADPDHPMVGALAGSALTMDRGINNLLQWLDLPEVQVWAMATCNPARVLGLSSKGTLAEGTDADLVVWEEENGTYRPKQTWVNGICVFER